MATSRTIDEATLMAISRRFVDALVAAWPTRDVSVEAIESRLVVRAVDDDGDPFIEITLGLTGSCVTYGWDGTVEDAEEIMVNAAALLAEEAEADRCVSGDGGSEYRT